MKIGIYVDVANDVQPRGVGYHVLHLIRALSQLDRVNEYLLYYPYGIGNGKPFRHSPDQSNFRPRPVPVIGRFHFDHPTLWWNYYFPAIVMADRVDIFHGPNHFLPALPRKKTILTIHDIAYFKQDLYAAGLTMSLRYWTTKALQRAGRIIALSENTRRDLQDLGVEQERIRVIYGGGNVLSEGQLPIGRKDDVRRQFGLPERYILCVGTLHPRKNVPFLLRSFAKLKKERKMSHCLVLAGKKDAAFGEIQELIRQLGIEQDVVITGYLEEWQLALLYKMAELFVLPSYYEGFGMILQEAMLYGVPVIASDTSCIREGVGGAAGLVPVNDDSALCDAMLRLLIDRELRQQLIERGLVQAQKFTWERCARETLALYKGLIAARRSPSLTHKSELL